MRRYKTPLFAAALSAAAVWLVAVSGCSRASALESFDLGEHDHLLAEAPGCAAECRAFGTRRTCTVREYDCKVVCMDVPDCRVAGQIPKVCAIMPTRRR